MKENMKLILQVDENDSPIGLVEKEEAHRKGILHRAFSIFVFREVEGKVELLLQRRALEKYHSGGLWTNTCCSHPNSDAPVIEAANMRLIEEMGFSCPLTFVDSFLYNKDVGKGMIEHEIDHVFIAFHNPSHIQINPDEACEYMWKEISLLKELLKTRPGEFTAWFDLAFECALRYIGQIV